MWSYFTFLDAAIAVYFVYFFDVQPLGYIVAILIGWRIMKDFMAGRDEIVLDFRSRKPKKRSFTTR